MIKKNYKDVHWIHKGTDNIDKVYKGTDLVFEQGYTREQTGVPPITTTYQAIGKNLKDYKIYGNSIQGKLPDTYQQVEYIKSTGTQYINTGINPISSTRIDINFAYVGTTYGGWIPIFGARSIVNNVQEQYAVFIDDRNLKLTTNYSSRDVGGNSNVYIEANKKYNLKNNQGLFYINDILESSISVSDTLSNNARYPVYLFDLNQYGSRMNRGTRMKLYSCKFYDGDTLIRNYIPCYRKSDNEIGLYDIVNNVFYTNQGTGVFLKGSNAPTPSNPIEIESVGDLITDVNDDNYGKYKIPVIAKSKNLFDDTTLSNKWINISGSVVDLPKTNCKRFECVEGETYTLSASYETKNANNIIVMAFYDINDTLLMRNAVSNLEYEKLIKTAPQNSKYFYAGCYTIEPQTIQLEKSDIATEYEPYVQPTTTNIYLDEPLRKVGDYSDYIDFGNSKVIRNNKEYSVTGQENISIAVNGYIKSDATDCYIPLIDIYDGDFGTVPSICNQLKYSKVGIWGTVGHVNEMTINHSQFHMNIENSLLGITNYESETISTAKEKITNYLQNKYSNGNPIKVLYPLQIPTEETILLPNIPTIKGTTIFEIDTNINASNMYIKYKGK